ncbi:39S ribosomal protein L14, mitochondrial [Trichonephila inaurata madagascariensis]|uniref:Large ribosomal subunit protein uL14m n=1 Tax=Trichonephila inaurata madagascariensis TaxID=2747483 RepID=A0A8X7CAW0_9ARAC|nr:39S ribosomal protein L14, mitochondrial [Trichonephila inaurata madagascariensis]
MKLTRLRVVDNSNLGKQAMLDGKPPRCIHVYNKVGVGTVGDRVLVAIKGVKKKALIVGVKGKKAVPMLPRFDSNNIVLLDDHGNPLGNRVLVPIPSALRGRPEFAKIIAISSRFL